VVKNVSFFAFSLANSPTIKKLFQKSNCARHPRTRLHLCAKFDILSLPIHEISFAEEKRVEGLTRHP